MLSVRPATPFRVLVRVPLAIVAAAPAFACGLSEVFAAAGRGDVSFVWESVTVFGAGDTIPILVSVLVKGERLESPRVRIAVPDTNNFVLNATGDSIVGRRAGQNVVVVELLTSLTIGEPIDTAFTLRVTGGGP